ncbi:MAG: GDSL-type esterase/lipase family protein [Dysgonomonas sp.]|nr:GDSL-type esterase/lipase family protein [Dysgonomonas sp.]
MKKQIYILIGFFCMIITSCSDNQIRVACVGDSITQGAASSDWGNKSYVALLANKLGKKYDVRNFGLSGTTAGSNTYLPYDQTQQFEDAKNFKPNIVTIALGTNDSQPDVWNTGDFAKNFEKDLINICEQFEVLNPTPKIYLCIPIPIILSDRWKHQPEVLSNEIIPKIKKIAKNKGYEVIDLYTPFIGKKEYYPSDDMLHPNDLGHQKIADLIYDKLIEK